MSSVDSIKFFKFLNEVSTKNGQGWFEEADTNSDDVIIKAEFRTFLNHNKDTFKEVTGVALGEDIINRFWGTIDTSKENNKIKGTGLADVNAAKKGTEGLANFDKNIEALNSFEIFYKNNVVSKTPSYLTGERAKIWQRLVREQLEALVNDFVNNNSKGDINALLADKFNEIKNKITAEQCDDEYKESLKKNVLAQYKEYKIDDDQVLNGLINDYINSVTIDTPEAEIYSGMKNVINNYLATAGIIVGNNNNVANGANTNNVTSDSVNGTTPNNGSTNQNSDAPLNPIQVAALTQRLTNELKEALASDTIYNNNKEVFDNIINEYVTQLVNNTTQAQFNSVSADVNVILMSEEYNKIKAIAEATKKISDIIDLNEGSEFYKALSSELGYDGDANADAKMSYAIKNLKDLPEYEKAIKDVTETIEEFITEDGSINSALIIKTVVKIIKDAVLAKADTTINSSESYTNINEKYSEYVDDASHITDTTIKTNKYKEIAINYCKTLIAKNSDFKALVTEAFGSENYADAINSMSEADVNKAIDKVKKKVNDTIQAETLTVSSNSWKELSSGNFSIKSTTTKPIKLEPSFKDKNGKALNITTDRITYGGESTPSGILTVNKNTGIVTIKGSSTTPGSYNASVSIFVDGVEVGTKSVLIEIIKPLDFSSAIDVKNTVNNESVSDIIKNKTNVVELCSFTEDQASARTASKSKINSVIDSIKNALISAGYNEGRADWAAKTLKNYYGAVIDTIALHNGDTSNKKLRDIQITYTDADGFTHTEKSQYYQKTYRKESSANGGDKAITMSMNSTGIQLSESYKSTNTFKLYVATAVVLTKFQDFFNDF